MNTKLTCAKCGSGGSFLRYSVHRLLVVETLESAHRVDGLSFPENWDCSVSDTEYLDVGLDITAAVIYECTRCKHIWFLETWNDLPDNEQPYKDGIA